MGVPCPAGSPWAALPEAREAFPLTERSGTSSWRVLLFPEKKKKKKCREHAGAMGPVWGHRSQGKICQKERGHSTITCFSPAPLGTPNLQHCFILDATLHLSKSILVPASLHVCPCTSPILGSRSP